MRLAQRIRRSALTVILCVIGAWLLPARQEAQGRAPDWDRTGAAQYLDERMELWFEKAKKLRTGETKTACVSCHMTVPYLLARPALRRALHVSAPTAQELRILDEATRRAATPDAQQPLYEHTESKKLESRGTEAVLNALLLSGVEAASKHTGNHTRNHAAQLAFARLWQTQRPDGAWDWLEFGLEPFETDAGVYFGATLAALAVGRAPAFAKDNAESERAGLEKLRAYLQAQFAAQSLFNQTWLLLASARVPGLLDKTQRAALQHELQRRQQPDGGWALATLGPWRWSKTAAPYRAPGTLDDALLAQSDGVATGLIVYALRQTGALATQPTVAKGLAWLRAQQQDVQANAHAWPAWRAHSLNFDREHGGDKGEPWRRMFMSDLATALAVLALLN